MNFKGVIIDQIISAGAPQAKRAAEITMSR